MEIIFITALFATSIVAVTFIVERGLALRKHKVIPKPLEQAVEAYQSPQDLEQLRRTCDYYPSTLSRLLLFATEHLDWSKTENVDVLETRARHEVTKLERGLVVLEIIVGIAPLLGLVGTIGGLIILFSSMGADGDAVDKARFAEGISLALWATLMGLVIAIPALVTWSYYSKKVETLAVEMESLCDELLRKHYRSTESIASAARAAAPPPDEDEQPELTPLQGEFTTAPPRPRKSRYAP